MASLDKGERSVLQVGGICGILSGISFIAAYTLPSLTLPNLPYSSFTCCSEEFFRQLPQFRTHFIVVHTLLPLAWALSIPLLLALYASLRRVGFRYALLGTVLGIVAAGIAAINLAAGFSYALGLAEIYVMGTDVDKRAVIAVAEVIQSSAAGQLTLIFVSLTVTPISIGVAVLKSVSFQRRYVWMSIIFGIILLPSGFIVSSLVSPPSGFVPIITIWITWLIVMGSKLYLLSRASTHT